MFSISALHVRCGFAVLFALIAFVDCATGCPAETADERWKSNQLESVAKAITNAETESERLEFVARQEWLRNWKPGKMPPAPVDAPDVTQRVVEPDLEELTKPMSVKPEIWRQMIGLQRRLREIDTMDQRKPNLREVVKLTRQLDQLLSDQLPDSMQVLSHPLGWMLAHARYRYGRALAYRELPDVRDKWPIVKVEQHDERLSRAYERLVELTDGKRVEFILLDDRMLRRSGQRGRALQLLELNREAIEPKWYLKKRRDLLKELGWEPPHLEAAKLYREAGYDD
ncbi:MAG: hypothetical protein AAGG48_10425 [Planctomycetota bacterium]